MPSFTSYLRDNYKLIIYIINSILLVAYVGLCSPHWENARGADAWEHHRAVVALSRQIWRPGNPTYATPEPSVRYSPYSLGLAMLARVSGADPYDLMCAAAVINTVLLVAGLYALLRVYRQQAAAAAVLVVVVALWGGAPGYANSLALADLPWHQMNPSAFALGLVLLLWTLVRGGERGQGAPLLWPVLAIIGAVALLTHAMTGVFGFGGLLLLALVAPADRHGRLLRAFGVITAIAVGLCLAWPWFDFLEAALNLRDRDYWFNPYILQMMLLQWCATALLLIVVALPHRREELIRFCLLGAAGCYSLALASFVVHSPTLAPCRCRRLSSCRSQSESSSIARGCSARRPGWLDCGGCGGANRAANRRWSSSPRRFCSTSCCRKSGVFYATHCWRGRTSPA